VLFTDIVGSTRVSEELGDRRWKAALDRHHTIVRSRLKSYGGRELDTAGDGFFASFREPASAIACACAAADDVRELGIEIRAGVHFGECERVGKKLAGITVVIGARIAALGGPGEVLVSGTAAELARGAGFGFEDRGPQALRGVEDELRVMVVTSVEGAPRPTPLTPDEARERRERIAIVAPPRKRKGWLIGASATAAALILGLVLAFAFFGGNEQVVPGPDTVARIDASAGSFDRVVSVGSKADPSDVAFGGGDLWVANVTNRTLVGIDPASGETRVVGLPSTPTGVAFADDRIWITFGFSSDEPQRLEVLDPTHAAPDPAPFSVPDGSYPVAAGANSLWVADPLGATATGFDPVTQKTNVVNLAADSGPVDLEVFEDGSSATLWVASGREPSVFRLDAAHPERPPQRFGTGKDVPTALTADSSGTVWVVSEDRDELIALAPSGTTRLNRSLGERCNGPVDTVAAGKSVWVSCALSKTVVRVDPSDGSVTDVLQVRGTPGGMAVDGDGAVWVTMQAV
jgi:streptogramin lyase